MRIWTDFEGGIVRASEEAARLFNLSQHNLEHRPIYHFFDGDRQQLFRALDRIARGAQETLVGVVRPREKRPCAVMVVLEPDEANSALVRWTLRPAPFKHWVVTLDLTPSAA